jgi:hypothetical protein
MKLANGSLKPEFWWTIVICGLIFALLGSRGITRGAQPLERAIFRVLESGSSYPDVPIQVCVRIDGEIRLVDAIFRSATGDTLIGRERLRDVYGPVVSGICHAE